VRAALHSQVSVSRLASVYLDTLLPDVTRQLVLLAVVIRSQYVVLTENIYIVLYSLCGIDVSAFTDCQP
jgi:hypothetical protein